MLNSGRMCPASLARVVTSPRAMRDLKGIRGFVAKVLMVTLMLIATFVMTGCDGERGFEAAGADVDSIDQARRIDEIQAIRESGDYDGVKQAIAQARADGIDDPRLAFYEAELLLQSGQDDDTEAALALLAEAVSGAPTWIEPRLIMADAFLRLQRPAAAGSVYQEFDRLFPEHPAGPYGQAVIAMMQGQNETAQTLLSEALTRDPDYAQAYGSLASVARMTGDTAAEQRALERYVALRPDSPKAWQQLGDRYLSNGRPENARRAFERSYALLPQAEVASRLAEIARSTGDRSGAEAWSQRASP